MKSSDQITRASRSGFTLVELLIVISIIALLAGLLTVAVQGARRAALATAVKTEVLDLETALEAFHAKYNVYPPSAIVLSEDPTTWTGSQLAELNRIWPQFNPANLDTDGDGTAGESGDDGVDFNGDGDLGDILELDGAECLAFFLGGVMATDVVGPSSTLANGGLIGTAGTLPTTWGALGFGKNPTNPFTRSPQARVGPFFEFDADRLKDVRDGVVLTSSGLDGMPSVIDSYPSQQTPLAYLRATPLGTYTFTGITVTAMSPVDNNSTSLGVAYTDEAGLPLNKKSFQLISPGQDGIFGPGGTYSNEDGVGDDVSRRDEADNISNFSNGVFGQ